MNKINPRLVFPALALGLVALGVSPDAAQAAATPELLTAGDNVVEVNDTLKTVADAAPIAFATGITAGVGLMAFKVGRKIIKGATSG
jgi:hypothetical protein